MLPRWERVALAMVVSCPFQVQYMTILGYKSLYAAQGTPLPHTRYVDVKLTFHSDDSVAASGNTLQVAQEADGCIRFDLATTSRLG